MKPVYSMPYVYRAAWEMISAHFNKSDWFIVSNSIDVIWQRQKTLNFYLGPIVVIFSLNETADQMLWNRKFVWKCCHVRQSLSQNPTRLYQSFNFQPSVFYRRSIKVLLQIASTFSYKFAISRHLVNHYDLFKLSFLTTYL